MEMMRGLIVLCVLWASCAADPPPAEPAAGPGRGFSVWISHSMPDPIEAVLRDCSGNIASLTGKPVSAFHEAVGVPPRMPLHSAAGSGGEETCRLDEFDGRGHMELITDDLYGTSVIGDRTIRCEELPYVATAHGRWEVEGGVEEHGAAVRGRFQTDGIGARVLRIYEHLEGAVEEETSGHRIRFRIVRLSLDGDMAGSCSLDPAPHLVFQLSDRQWGSR